MKVLLTLGPNQPSSQWILCVVPQKVRAAGAPNWQFISVWSPSRTIIYGAIPPLHHISPWQYLFKNRNNYFTTHTHTVTPHLKLFWLYMVETKHTGKNCPTIRNLNVHGQTWHLLIQSPWKLVATPTHVMS